GGGKCLGKDTPVLMADGSILPVQEIKVGDRIMGDDSMSRNVLSVTTGKENLYRITPIKGESWVCNESHILSLVATGTGCGFVKGKVYDIELRDYLLLNKTQKHLLKQYRTGVFFFGRDPEEIPLDPYFLGVLIGDGSLKRGVCITTPDKEIIDEIYKQADLFNLSVRHETMENNKSSNYYIVAKDWLRNGRKGGANPITNILKGLGANVICSDKFVPDAYKKGTRQTRLQILAGLIDTDGYLCHNFEYSSKSKTLADDVVFIARSLGFAAYISKKIVNEVTYYRVTISGDLHKIPTRIKRKQAEPRKQKKSVLRTGFTVTPIGEGDYYGFEIDGNRRFVLGDFTVTHNTVIFVSVIKELVNQGKRGLLLVHRRELIRQAEQKIFKAGINYGHIMSGVDANYSRPMQLASVQTLVRRNMPKRIDFVIIDEAHHATASSYRQIINEYPDAKIIGFTATPCRRDGSGFEDIFEKLVLGPSVKFLIQNAFLVEPKIYSVPLREDLSKLKTVAGDYRSSDIEAIMDRDVVNGDIVETYKKYALGKKCVVFATTVKHSLHIVERYNAAGIAAVHIDGETPTETRDIALRKFAKGDYLILSNVEIVTEGFDVPAIECVQLVRPTQSLSLYLQMAGRGLRSAHGKDR
ncbi:MAG TPA: Hint domain-containing homing endonuclease, partial [Candidatus Kapabacteria bacterium]|nr:Hint domain-containing homing endonuclease [Candidatus Kapabacteria bacterium]